MAHEELLARLDNMGHEIPPPELIPLAKRCAAALRSTLAELDELKFYELACLQLTEAMERWGWQHCTAGPELIAQIDKTLAELEAQSLRLAEWEAIGIEKDSQIGHLGQQLASFTEASASKTDWCPCCKQGWHVVEQIAAERKAREEAERSLICDVCLGKPLLSGKSCCCKGTGNLVYTLQGTRENLASEWQRAEAAERKLAEVEKETIERVETILTEWDELGPDKFNEKYGSVDLWNVIRALAQKGGKS